jgi:hypothetical protein
MTTHDEHTLCPEAFARIEQALARIEIESDHAAMKIEAASKAAAADAVDAAKQIAVLIERVSAHIDRRDLHGQSEAVVKLQDQIRSMRTWLIGVLFSVVCALGAVVWKVVWDHVQTGGTP